MDGARRPGTRGRRATPGRVHRGHVVVDADIVLEPGWYALVFGGDLAGASAMGEYAGPAFGHAPEPGEQTAFSISTRSGAVYMQRAGARFFVRGTPVP